MDYNFNDAVKAKESGKRLSPGIKTATFQGVEFETRVKQDTGDVFKVLSLKLNVDDFGEFTQSFFEPQSAERQEMQWGLSASQLDHFKIAVIEILEAVAPEVVEKINAGELSMSGNFKQIVEFVKKWTADKIGTKVEIKLLPQKGGFVSMPSFPARITRNGELGIATRIIGHDLVMTSSEQKRIDAAKEATPTDMTTQVNVSDSLLDMKADFDSDKGEDDLPF